MAKQADEYFGKKTRDLGGVFIHERRRVAPGLFTDIDREYRAKFLKANHFTKRDMSYHLYHLWDNPDFRKFRLNPIRRVWQAPGEVLEHALRPHLGMEYAFLTRLSLTKSLMVLVGAWYSAYYFMYSSGEWSREGGLRTFMSKPITLPTNPSYPKKDPKWERETADYSSMGFNKDKVAAQLEPSAPLRW
uniref:Lethal 35Di n=1 Tax=Acartia pacifica TaxID=335913 RepID=A0A0U2IG16_ACAPC|nr:lethal 35Di [Acartia pacifica]